MEHESVIITFYLNRPMIIKLFSCNSTEDKIHPAQKCYSFNIYEQDKFHAHLI